MIAGLALPPGAAALAWRAVLVAAAGLLLAAQAVAPATAPVAAAPPASSAAAPPVSPPPSSELGASYPAILDRPLFSPTRQRWVPEPAEPVRTPPPPAPSILREYVLLGIVAGNGASVAVLKPPRGDKAIRLAEGEAIDGWVLREIGAERLRFQSDSGTFELSFPNPRWRRP